MDTFKKIRSKRLRDSITVNTVLIILGIFFIIPLVWMVTTAFKTPEQSAVFPPQWIPDPFSLRSFREALSGGHFLNYLKNTVIITFLTTIGTLISSCLVAFGFARLKCRYKQLWFTLMLSTMMIPSMVTLIPMYTMYSKLGLVDTFIPLVLPFFFGASVYSIFLLRQFFLAIPKELSEAAFIDGYSWFGVFWKIYIPNSKPAILVVTMFSFVNSWNDFFNPMIYLSTPSKFTISIGLAAFQKMYGGAMDVGPMMAMSLLCVTPVIVLYIFCQRYFIQGVVTTGIKG